MHLMILSTFVIETSCLQINRKVSQSTFYKLQMTFRKLINFSTKLVSCKKNKIEYVGSKWILQSTNQFVQSPNNRIG